MSETGDTDPWGNPIPQPPSPPQPSYPAPGQPFFPPDPAAGPPPPGSQPPQGWPTPANYGGPPYGPPRTEGTAIGSLVCALVGLLLCGIILEPIAIILGFHARRKIRASGGTLKGEGLASAGIVVGFVGVALAIVGIIIVVNNPDLLDNFRMTTTSVPG